MFQKAAYWLLSKFHFSRLNRNRSQYPMIRTLIVDDEPLSRRKIREFLKEDSEIEVVGECGNGPEAVSAVRNATPDLLFLDVQMPGMDGFGVLEELRDERMPFVIFVTAFDKYAVKA